jgi:SAM-dependent methyltransferase
MPAKTAGTPNGRNDRTYRADLAFIHDAGFLSYAERGADVTIDALRRAGIRRGLVVDLGCGSGATARRLSAAGYDVLGVDLSPAMIALARKKAPRASFRVGSFVDAAIPPCVAVTAVGEVLNYAFDGRSDEAALRALVRRVAAALQPGGVFVLDVLGPGHVGGDGTRTGHREGDGWAVLVSVVEDRHRRSLEREITTFRRVGSRWRRDHETHRQQLLRPSRVASWLRGAGLRVRRISQYGPLALGRAHVGFVARRLVGSGRGSGVL